jgi:hypothetical protein
MSDAELHFIPGCYRNLQHKHGESLPGFLLRLAEANDYAGIREMLMVVGIQAPGHLSRLITQVKLSGESLEVLGAMAVGNTSHLLPYLVEPIGDEALLVQGCRVDNDAYLHEHAQICPVCLAQDGFALEEWELAVVTACSRHKVLLRDRCHACNQPIDWGRPHLAHCSGCGSDFRAATLISVDDSICDVVQDFAALAPFRVILRGDEHRVLIWDTAFRLFKSLLIPSNCWASAEWPKRCVQSAPLELRHKVIETMASARQDDGYVLTRMNTFVHELLTPLNAVPRSGLIERQAMKLLHSAAGLPWDVAETVCSGKPLLRMPAGAELFNGHPPSLTGLREVAAFLAVDRETVAGLIKMGLIDIPTADHPGFDIDQILVAQKFLSEGLLTIAEVAMLVGVALDWHDHGFDELLPVWNPKHPADSRLPVQHLVNIQLQLTAKWREAGSPIRPVSLRTIAVKSGRPFQTVAMAVNMALSGGFARMGWGPQFDWASLRIEESESERIAAILAKDSLGGHVEVLARLEGSPPSIALP